MTRTQRLHRQRNREELLRTSRAFGEQVGEAALLAAVPWAKDEEDEDEEEEEIEAVKVPKQGETPSETPPAQDEPAAKTDEPPVESPPGDTPAEPVAEAPPAADEKPAETPVETPTEKPAEEEEKPKEPPIETAPKPDEESIDPELVDDEDELDEDEIDAECHGDDEKRKLAAQLTLAVTGLVPIEAFNPYPRQAGGLFGFKGGGMSDEGANAASESANSASKAAQHGAGSHMEAARAHANAANHAQRVANRSKMEYEMAMARGDKLSADAHAKELERASRGATYHEMEAAKEASTPDTPQAGAQSAQYAKSGQSMIGRITRATLRVAGGTAMAVGTTAAVGGVGASIAVPGAGAPVGIPLALGGGALALVGKGLSRLGRNPDEPPKPEQTRWEKHTKYGLLGTTTGRAVSEGVGSFAKGAAKEMIGPVAKGIGTGLGKAAEKVSKSQGTKLGDMAINKMVERAERRAAEREASRPKSPFAPGSTPYYKAEVVREPSHSPPPQLRIGTTAFSTGPVEPRSTPRSAPAQLRIGYTPRPESSTSSTTIRTPGIDMETLFPHSINVGSSGHQVSSATVGGYAPSERTFRRAAAARRVSASEITDSIMASLSDQFSPIHASVTDYGDIIAVANRVTLSHQSDIKATGEITRTPRFTIAPAYNGGPLKVERYPLPIIVDLAGMTVNPQSVQAVLFHDGDRLVGHVDSIQNNKRTLVLAGPLSGLQSSVDEFSGSMKRGFPWKASIEARPLEKPEHIPAGKRVVVNGQTFDGPVLVARKTELYGVSFVPRGADDKTQVSIAARAARNFTIKEKNPMEPITFAEWLSQGLGLIEAELSPTQKTALQAKYDEALAAIKAAQRNDPEPPPPTPPPEDPKPPTDGFELDIIRAKFDMKMDELDNLYAKYEIDENLDKMKFIGIKAEAKKSMQDLRAAAIDKRMNGDLFDERCNVIRAGAQLKLVQESRPKGPAIHNISRGDPELTGDILAAAVMQTGRYQLRQAGYDSEGHEQIKVVQRPEDIYAAPILEAAEKKFRRGIGLQELIIEAAQANGWSGRSFRQNPTECMQYAFPMQSRNQFGAPIQASAFSTVDVAGILSNVANKFLLQGFFFVEQAWRDISDIRTVTDFKTVTSYRLTGAEEFKEVAPGGEIQHGTLGEESYTNKANTYGLMLSVTRTDVINDDLGAITTVPRKLGKGAGLALNKVFWTKFLGQISTLFTAARLNYFSGAATNLQISSLTTAEQMFMDLKDANLNPIGHMPTILLTPTGLSATAASLFKDTEIRKTGSTDNTYTVGNPHQGKFRPVVSRYIANSTYTGYTATGWGIFADPQDVAVMEMCFLNGNESPTVEQAIADFNQLGIQMRAYMDFGVNTQDYRGAVWSKGAA